MRRIAVSVLAGTLWATAVLPVAQPSVAAAGTSFVPVADAYVDANQAGRNFGARTFLLTDATPERISYIKFDVQGVGVVPSAALRVYALRSNPLGFEVHAVSDSTWGESLLTYRNRPALDAVVGESGPVISGNWYSIDVSAAVSGDGLVTLALTGLSRTATRYSSREGSFPSELVIPAPVGPSHFVVSRDKSVYTAEEQSTGTIYTGDLKDVVEQATLDLDQAGGGMVTFESGKFDLGSDHFELDNIDNVTFEGQGINKTTIRNSSSVAFDTEVFDLEVAHGVEIRDMTVVAGGTFRSTSDAIDCDNCDDVVIENVKISGSRARGIVFDGKNLQEDGDAVRNTIRNCKIVGVPSDGIEILASSQNTIEGCKITDVGGHGIQIVKSSSIAGQPNKKSNDNLVSGNHIENAGLDGINIISSDRNQVIGNTVLNSSDDAIRKDGIRIQATNGISCDDNEIEQNTATDDQEVKTQRYGLNISSPECNRTTVKDNFFAGNLTGYINDNGTGTISIDTLSPTVPTNLSATAVTHVQVDLAWDPSTDNMGVDSYTIYRDGVPIGTVNGATTAYQDKTGAPNTSYRYEAEAFDAAGNPSGTSDPFNVTTEAPPTSFIFNPVSDSYVDEANPDVNFGSSTAIRMDVSPEQNAYVRFNVSTVFGTVTSATLRVYANSGSTVGADLSQVTDNSWDESTITFNNAPVIGGTVGSSGPFSASQYIEWNVTTLVSGDGTYTFALTTPHTTAISFSSREGANPAELVLEVAP